jgi:hypothetical protein
MGPAHIGMSKVRAEGREDDGYNGKIKITGR